MDALLWALVAFNLAITTIVLALSRRTRRYYYLAAERRTTTAERDYRTAETTYRNITDRLLHARCPICGEPAATHHADQEPTP